MWKTVSARIRGAKAELEEAGEDTEGMVESTSKLRALVKGFTGFDIMEDEKTFKSIYDIILGIGEKWQDLNDIDRAALLEALAGKRAGNALAAALNNVDDLKAAYETALNASGSAMKEQENYEKSIQYSIDRLKATAQDLAQDFMSSDFIKGAVDFLNKILELLDAIVEKTGSLVPILTALGTAYASVKVGKTTTDAIGSLKELLDLGKSKKSFSFGGIIDWLKQPAFKNATQTMTELSDAAANTAVEVNETLDIMAGAQGAATYSEAMGSAAASTAALETTAAGATISVGALLGIIAAAVAVVAGAVIIYDALTISVEEATEYMDKWNKTLDENKKKLESQRQVAEKAKESYFELAEGVNTLNNQNINLSDEDYNEFISLNNELAEQFPELITGIDTEGNYIINLGDNAAQAATKLQELIDRQERLNNIEIANSLSETFENSKVLMEDNEKSAKSFEFQIENFKKSLSDLNSEILSDKISSNNIETMNMLVKSLKDSGLYNDLIDQGLAGYEDSLDEYGNIISEFYINTTTLSEEQKAALKDVIDTNSAIVKQDLIDSINSLETQLENEAFKSDATWQSFVYENLVPAMHSKAGYNTLSESGKQLADALVSGLSSGTASAMENYKDPYEYIQQEIIPHLDELENQVFKSLDGNDLNIMDLFNGDLSNEELVNLYTQIQSYFKANGIELSFKVGEDALETDNEFNSNLENIIGYNPHTKKYREEKEKLVDITKELSTEEKKTWNSVISGAKNADEAIQLWNKHLEETSQLLDKISNKPLSTSETIDELDKLGNSLSPLDKAFSELYDKDDMEVDLSSIKAIKDSLLELNENFDLSSVETQLETLYNAKSPQEAQEAVNDLCTAFLNTSTILEKIDSNNRDLIESDLKRLGITNSHILVLDALDKAGKQLTDTEKEELATIRGTSVGLKETTEYYEKNTKAGYDAVDATKAERDELYKQAEAANLDVVALGELELAQIACNNAKMDFSQQLSALQDLFEQLNLDTTAAYGLAAALSFKNQMEVTGHGTQYEFWSNKSESEKKAYQDELINNAIEDARKSLSAAYEPIKADYSNSPSVKAAKEASSAAKDAAETFDWLETKIQRCEEEIQRLDKTVSATYKGWSKRNGAIASELDKVREKIQLQMTAYDVYMKKANSIGLSDTYKQLVMHGGLKIEEISDENLKKQINDFKTFYEKAIAAKDAVEDLNAQLTQLAKQKFDNVKSEFEGFTSEIEHFVNMIDKELSHVENMEKIAGKSFYTAKMDQDEQRLEELNKERTALLQALREAEANGVEEGSADWIAMRNDIYSVDEAIADLTYELEDLKKKLKEVAKLNFDDLKSQFENALSLITGQVDLTDAVVSMTQNAGYIASREYYKALIEGSKENVTALRKEYTRLSDELTKAMSSGDIEKYDKQWYEMSNSISNVKKELVDAANATIEYANALRQIDWDVFDRGLDRISKLIDEGQFFIDLLEYSKLFDKDTGAWTDEGITTRGLMVERYQEYMDQANAYGSEAEEIRKLLEGDPKNVQLADRYYELIDAQQQAILNAKREKKAIEDLYKNGYDNLLDVLRKLIQEYRDGLNAAKDLYDYQKNIENQTANIGNIEKQIQAYSGSADSEETRATLQRLNSQLKEAQEELQKTEYDKYIEDQGNLLDSFLEQLEDWFNSKIDESNALFEEAVAATNLNGKLIDDTLHEEAAAVNYRMTDEFANIWDQYAAEDGIAAGTLNILTLTNEVTTDIRAKMEELPTEARLEEFFNSDDLRLLQELTSVKYNTAGMIDAINSTNSALDQIKSNIVEYSGILGQKIDYAGGQVTSAINSLEFSSGNTSYSAPSGGGGGGSTTTQTPKQDTSTNKTTPQYKNYFVTVQKEYDDRGYKLNKPIVKETYNDKTLAEAQKLADQLIKNGKNSGGYVVRVNHYKRGGLVSDNKNFLDSIARLLGEDHMVAAKEGERILTEEQNKAFEKMVNANFTPLNDEERNKYTIDKMIEGMTHIQTPNVGNVSNIGNTTTVGDINITLPNVTNKEEFVQWLRTDGQVEKIIQSLTIGRMMGKNSFDKMKY